MLMHAIEELPHNYQEIFKLRSFEDKTFVAIGQKIGCSADAARKLWSRAIIRLQEFLAKPSPPPESI